MGKKAVEEVNGGEGRVLDVETAKEIAQYDLLPRMAPYMDTHLMFPILRFAHEAGIYKKTDVAREEIKLLSGTRMLEFAADKYKEIGEEVPEEITARTAVVTEEIRESMEKNYELLKLLESEQKVHEMQDCKTMEKLRQDLGIELEDIEDMLHYARLLFQSGAYFVCHSLVKFHRNMPWATEGEYTKQQVEVLWGSLASSLLTDDMMEAASVICMIDGHLEKAAMTSAEIMVHRTWLLHWTLFALFCTKDPDTKVLVDVFLKEKNMSIIALACPWLFRYVGAVLILQKRLKHLVKDTVWIIHHEAASYSDPVTRFLLALYTDMDYEEAQREMERCEQVCMGDYFLHAHWVQFQENARLHIFESYCRIHQCINIEMLASRLNMDAQEAELWIVRLIQNAKIDARIDSEKHRVVMTKAPPTVYQQVIEKTKNLAFRSTMLVSNLEKKN